MYIIYTYTVSINIVMHVSTYARNAMKTSTTHLEDVKFNGRKKNCSKGFFSGFFYIPIVKLI